MVSLPCCCVCFLWTQLSAVFWTSTFGFVRGHVFRAAQAQRIQTTLAEDHDIRVVGARAVPRNFGYSTLVPLIAVIECKALNDKIIECRSGDGQDFEKTSACTFDCLAVVVTVFRDKNLFSTESLSVDFRRVQIFQAPQCPRPRYLLPRCPSHKTHIL